MADFDHHLIPHAVDFPLSISVHGFAETQALGEKVAGLLKGGEIILLHGALGAGKTCFVQGLCKGLSIESGVVSPTFTLVNSYSGSLTVHHLDFYRVENHDNLNDIGVPDILDEVWDGQAVVLVEWPTPLLPQLGSDPQFELLATHAEGIDCRNWHLRSNRPVPTAWMQLFNAAKDTM